MEAAIEPVDKVEAADKPVDKVRAANEAAAGRPVAKELVQMATLKSLSKAVRKMGLLEDFGEGC